MSPITPVPASSLWDVKCELAQSVTEGLPNSLVKTTPLDIPCVYLPLNHLKWHERKQQLDHYVDLK
ncbi:hypothetical protein J6590_012865 [Homalodisca vitripennis]|nr:hypothetical protein J6590_012865 [Homalodisca vitripennis]